MLDNFYDMLKRLPAQQKAAILATNRAKMAHDKHSFVTVSDRAKVSLREALHKKLESKRIARTNRASLNYQIDKMKKSDDMSPAAPGVGADAVA
jgi:hypothetical protein